jgi:O-antigen/teichoic acid export membrane protein
MKSQRYDATAFILQILNGDCGPHRSQFIFMIARVRICFNHVSGATMNQVQRIVKNIGVTGSAQILTALMSFVFMIYLARFLGEAGFGKYNFAFSLTTLLVTFTDLGVNQLLVREIARERDLSSYYVNNAVFLKIPLSILTFVLIAVLAWTLNLSSDASILLYLFGIYNILLTVSGTYLSLFQAWERMEYVALFQIIERLFIVTLGLGVLIMGYGLMVVAWVYVFAGILDIAVAASLSFRRFIRPSRSIDTGLQKKLLLMGLPFGLNSLFAVFFFKIDTVLLGLLRDDVAVGIYNAAYNPLLALSMIVAGMVSAAVYPVMSRYFREDAGSLSGFTRISSRYLAIAGFPVAAGCLVLADRFIGLFYAGGYGGAVPAFQILALFIPIRLVSTITGTLLSSIDRQEYRMLSVGISAAFNIVLNMIFIPYYSYIGAAAATVLSELLLYILFLYYIGKAYDDVKLNREFIKPAAASALMALMIYPLREINLLLVIGAAALIYLISLILLREFREEDRALLMNLLGRNT